MTLARFIRFATLGAALITAAYTGLMAWVLHDLSFVLENERHASAIRQSVFELYDLTQDHLIHPEETRPQIQWQAHYRSLDGLMRSSYEKFRPHHWQVLSSMHENLKQMNQLFTQFSVPQPGESISPLIFEQITLKCRRILSLSETLTRRAKENLDQLIYGAIGVMIFFLLSVIVFAAGAIYWFHRYILIPLDRVRVTAEKVRNEQYFQPMGLSHRRDEIGYMAKTLNEMTYHLLESGKKLESEMNEKISAQKEMMVIQEREQKRVGQDLHDSIAQQLTGLSFMCQLAKKRLAAKKAPEENDLQQMLNLIKDIIDETRHLARIFYPVDLERHGIAPALTDLTLGMEKTFKVPCRFKCTDEISMETEKAVHIYRIAQEAIHNAIRHGQPQKIELALFLEKGKLVLSIEDDGKGMPSERAGKGMGFRNMHHRASLIQGNMEVVSRPGQGTRILIRMPYRPAASSAAGSIPKFASVLV